jgi:hypothetical protein
MSEALENFARRVIGFEKRAGIDAAAGEVMAAFAQAGIGALVLKGPVTARWLYTPTEVRGYTDCDILAAPDRFASAGRTLRELGFHLHVDEATHPEVRDEGRSQVWHRLPQDVWIDLQWRLPGIGLAPGQAWELLWADHETMMIGTVEVTVPSEPARALHLATAAATAAAEPGKALIDLRYALDRLAPAVWAAAEQLAGTLNALPALRTGLTRVAERP